MSLTRVGQELLDAFRRMREAEEEERVRREKDEKWLADALSRVRQHLQAGQWDQHFPLIPVCERREALSNEELGRVEAFARALGLPNADGLRIDAGVAFFSEDYGRSFSVLLRPRALCELLEESAK